MHLLPRFHDNHKCHSVVAARDYTGTVDEKEHEMGKPKKSTLMTPDPYHTPG